MSGAAAGAARDRPAPVLVGCSHGTRDPAGRRAVTELLDGVRSARPGLEVVAAYVDVQQPEVADVVREVTADGRTAVVVPLLLSSGYHTNVDVARAVEAAAPLAVAAGTLGPDPRLVELLTTRLHAAGATSADAVVLAAAGSSDPRAARDVEQVVEALALARAHGAEDGVAPPGPTVAAYGSASRPSVPDAVGALRDQGHARVVVASYLLAPGFFHDRLSEAGADVVTAPLAPDALLVDLVLDRYDAAARRLPALR